MYAPVSLKVGGEPVLVVGGGSVALRKARALARAGAQVTCLAPDFLPGFQKLRARRVRRRFRTPDVRGAVLVVASTDDPRVNRAVYAACRRRGIPVNVVDVPELCSFIVPAVIRRGPVVVAVSTGGRSPSLAKALRKRLEVFLPVALGPLARRLGAERRRLLRSLPPSPERTRRLKRLVRKADLRKAGLR
jgi:uroporphyrin-III C-methyltransferase/precorrin-2 dehydrogenase/sirohydrochlorin ferrochelatase